MRTFFLSIIFLVIFFSCGNEVVDQEIPISKALEVSGNEVEAQIIEPKQDEEVIVLEKEGIIFTEIKPENNEEASLALITEKFKEGENRLNFKVTGMVDYSIAIIENNSSIAYHQNNIISKEFLYGNNVFLAYLTYPNGIGVKRNKALVLKNVLIDDESLFNMNQPHLFYFLPKEKTVAPILDFCLVNTTIKEGGNQLKVTINGINFIINKWAAYKIKGLTKKENSIRIQLIDKNGELIEGPFNDSGERQFEIATATS